MIITTRNLLAGMRLCFFTLLSGAFLFASAQSEGLTNRTPDKAKIYPEKAPPAEPPPEWPSDATLIADPALVEPGKGSKPVSESQSTMAYYVYLRGVSRVLVSDVDGRVDDLFQSRFVPKITSATYDLLTPDTVSIVVPVNRAYSITFESSDPVMVLEIAKGRGNVSPEEAIRYRDLTLGRGSGRLQITSEGVGSLRVDMDHDGQFEKLIEPTAILRGPAASDRKGPECTFAVLERNATTILISIRAEDKETGLKNIYYSLDGHHAFLYQSPVRISLNQASSIYAFAEDLAGNRSVSKYKF